MRVPSGLIHLCVAIASLGVLSCGDSEGPAADGTVVDCEPGTFGLACEPCPAGTTCDGSTLTPTQCAAGTWDHDEDPATGCEPWTACAAGTFVASEGSATGDRTCEACPDGAFSTAANASQCETWSVCPAGTFVDAEGDAERDRTCTGCSTGTFSVDPNQGACQAWTVCAPGTYVSTRGSESADQACAPCPSGETSEGENAASCTPIGACPAGTAGDDCEACAVGQYCAGDGAPALDCADGTWDHDADPASACAPWTECVAGERVEEGGSATSDRACADCVVGSFTDAPNQSACQAWAECAPGTRVSSAGSTTADRACAPCASGTYADATNADACVAWTDCAAGQQVAEAGSARADRTCEACPEGTFSVAANTPACTDWSACPAGTAEGSGGGADTDRACDTCDVGTFCAGGDADAVACGSGDWDHDASAATACEPWTVCGPGAAQQNPGSATADRTCAPCVEGTYAAGSGSETCSDWSDCVAGQRVVTSPNAVRDRGCDACASGSFSTTVNADACASWTDCAPGEFVGDAGSATADRTCDDCPDDTYSASPNAATCTPVGACPAGTVQVAAGSSTAPPTCEACQAGTFCAGGTAAPAPCPAGQWDHDANPASACEDRTTCGPGTFVTSDGDATTDRTCDDCAVGAFSSASNQTGCAAWSDCDAGTFVAVAGSTVADRSCQPCEVGYTDAPNETECAAWSDACGGPELAAPTSTRDRVCADPTPCAELLDADACQRSVQSCSWSGDTCAEQSCAAITDPDTCSRYPECEFDYASTFACSDDETPPATCAAIAHPERCVNSALGCTFDTDAGACVDAGEPRDCVLGGFGEWSPCSQPCEGGERSRTQVVIEDAVGGVCNPATQTEPCNAGVTCSCDLFDTEFACSAADGCAWDADAALCGDAAVDCELGPWTEFSACSLPCEGGTQTRTREVLVEPANGGAACGITEESQNCNAGVPCVCSELTTIPQCDMVDDCGWMNDRCEYDGPIVSCDELTDQASCEAATELDCIWIDALDQCLTI